MPAATSTPEQNKRVAKDFLRTAGLEGRVREAYDRFVSFDFVHHNAYFAAGRDSLMRAMEDAHRDHPNELVELHHAVAEGDLVATHSRVRQRGGARDSAVVHLFRFRDGKIVELWDVGMQAPENSPNAGGLF